MFLILLPQGSTSRPKCPAQCEAAVSRGGAEAVRAASLVHRRDERGSGASWHPKRALPGQGTMESGKWRVLQRQWAACLSPPTPSPPVSSSPSAPQNNNSLFIRQCPESFLLFLLKYLTCGLDSLGSRLSVQVGLLQYKRSKNSLCSYLWQCSAL